MTYNSIKVVKGNGGYGGPLVITPTEEKHKFIYITGGGEKPANVDKNVELTGMEAGNGFKTSIPNDENALAIFVCGGPLPWGIFPNINPGELFVWLGIAQGIDTLGLNSMDLAIRYMFVGILMNFIGGWGADFTNPHFFKKKRITLSKKKEIGVD
ncbi:PTS glucitol/sorbitol transporter subunit IIC [Enterococcus faecalis]|uniref:PTS glucitol/sorbitol transporter subunit IIC n=1 Tax=Enterococcus faecalis TaxID=1351 RepID=UPI003CCC7D1C